MGEFLLESSSIFFPLDLFGVSGGLTLTSWLYFFHSRKYFKKICIGNGCVPDIVKGSGDAAEVKRTQTFSFPQAVYGLVGEIHL